MTTPLSIMTWNIEGLRRNIFNLKHFLETLKPDWVFLCEPQIYECDVNSVMSLICDYSFLLNSPDKFDPDLPLVKSKANGGTMILWKSNLEPYIAPIPSLSTSYLPVLLHPPGLMESIHVCIYLPTHGQDQSFCEELTNISETLSQIRTNHPHVPIFLRGDFNVNRNNRRRQNLFDTFKDSEGLLELNVSQPTYHHFLGDGSSDSNLDKILHSNQIN